MPNYTKNPTWADGSGGGTPITAAKLNNVESGIFDAHYQAAARVYHNATQSINNITNTVLSFNSERYDTESNAASTIHDTVTNNSRLTCRTAGKYQIIAQVSWAANATGYRTVSILLNGTTWIGQEVEPSNSASVDTSMSVATHYDLSANDYVQVEVYQNSGGALNVQSTANIGAEFMMARVA